MYPKARRRDVLESNLLSEQVVYDLGSHTAFALNDVATGVWRRCDGRTSIEAIAEDIASETGVACEAEVVALAVDRLGRAGLLEEAVAGSVSRRAVLARLGTTAALMLPVVTALVVPTPAMATSGEAPPPPPPPPPPIDFGCTYTQGYWKNHPDNWPTGYTQSMQFLTATALIRPKTKDVAPSWRAVFKMPSDNYFFALAQQYMAAELNRARAGAMGWAVPASVTLDINAARLLLLAYINSSGVITDMPSSVGSLLNDRLDRYNNGLVRPGPVSCG